MKRIYTIISAVFVILFIVTGCSPEAAKEDVTANAGILEKEAEGTEHTGTDGYDSQEEELVGVWCNYNELSMKSEKGGDEEMFREKVRGMFSAAVQVGVNAVFVQVRPFCDAFYDSELFPWSEYLTGEQGADPGYDPLEIMIEEARELQLKIHGWINPYRVSYKSDITLLSEDNPARKLCEEGDGSVYVSDKGIYLNPASEKAKKLVTDGVAELLRYDLDGIHMDDYFYPDGDEEIDGKEYEAYRQSGGELSLAQWRRNQVSALVGGIYGKIKSEAPQMVFGISPSGDIDKNYNDIYADLELWCSKAGYVDYIMPQLYYGFDNETMPFEETADRWAKLASGKGKVKLYGGLALYKCGTGDEYAGAESENRDTGRYEWINSDDIISRQISYLRESGYGGFVFYSWQSIEKSASDAHLKSEFEKIMGIL